MGKKEDQPVAEEAKTEGQETTAAETITDDAADKTADDVTEDEQVEDAGEEAAEEAAPAIPTEVKSALEQEYPALKGEGHGTHNAAKSGLQTDASGGYDRSKL